MARPDPYKLPGGSPRRPDDLSGALKRSLRKPSVGVTQGGSSRKFGGARVAATDGQVKPKRRRK